MKTLGYYNGKFGELDEMSIPMNDRVCWFGDGVYDAGLSRNYKIFALTYRSFIQQRRTSGYQSACDKSRTGGLAPGNGKQNGYRKSVCLLSGNKRYRHA